MNRLFDLTKQEWQRQRDTLNLIASENYPSPKVLDLLGSVWQNKYAEGYPGKRFYAGNVYSDELEDYVQKLALKLFDPTGQYGVNVQVLSGSPANAMVFLAQLEPGDIIMSLDLPGGGHLSHVHSTSSYLKFFKPVNYSVKATDNGFEIDADDFKSKLAEHKPKLVIIGFSAYPPAYEFGPLCQLAHQAGSLVLADIAHINGLVAVGRHDSPFKPGNDGADFVSMTTHKTLRGPRGAILFARGDLINSINKTVFPGSSGGPHLHQIAAIGQALLEALGEDEYPDRVKFSDYIDQTLKTCQALEQGLRGGGLEIVSPTQTHLTLVKLPEPADSLEVQKHLEATGLITNRNAIPFETKTAWRPSGLRLGTPALASRGLTEDQATQIGQLVAGIVLGKSDPDQVSKQAKELAAQLKWWYEEPNSH